MRKVLGTLLECVQLTNFILLNTLQIPVIILRNCDLKYNFYAVVLTWVGSGLDLGTHNLGKTPMVSPNEAMHFAAKYKAMVDPVYDSPPGTHNGPSQTASCRKRPWDALRIYIVLVNGFDISL